MSQVYMQTETNTTKMFAQRSRVSFHLDLMLHSNPPTMESQLMVAQKTGPYS